MSDNDPAFVPIRDADGNVRGVMDRLTADYLASTEADPTQASIDALLATVTRVRVVAGGMANGRALGTAVLLDIADAEAVAGFRGCFRIVEDPATFGHCMCLGNPAVEVYAGERLAATIGYHHGFAIRWEAWKHDAYLAEPDRLLDWLSAHGVEGPRAEVEADRRRAEESRRRLARWVEAMPACLRDVPGAVTDFPGDAQPLVAALRTAHPREDEQIRTLLRWFASGAGPWSGYPSYESVVEKLLDAYPARVIAAVLAEGVDDLALIGAARLFSVHRRKDGAALPAELKRRLREAAARTGIDDNHIRAEHTLAGEGRFPADGPGHDPPRRGRMRSGAVGHDTTARRAMKLPHYPIDWAFPGGHLGRLRKSGRVPFHASFRGSTSWAITATQSPWATSDGARVQISTPADGATTATGSRSGRSRKWIAPTASPAATSRPSGTRFS